MFIYTEYSRGNKGRSKIRQEETSKERRNKKEEGRRDTISGKQTDKEEITETKPELETIYCHRTHYLQLSISFCNIENAHISEINNKTVV